MVMHRMYMSNFGMVFFFSNSEVKGVPDESDRFLMDPVGFASEFVKNWSQPTHIVLFDSEEKLLKDFLLLHSFQEVCITLIYLLITLRRKTIICSLHSEKEMLTTVILTS